MTQLEPAFTISAAVDREGWEVRLEEPDFKLRIYYGQSLKEALLWAIEQYEPLLAVELGADPTTVLRSALARKAELA